MNVWLFPTDVWGCGHLRMHWPAEAVRDLDEPDVGVIEVAPDQRQVGIEFDSQGNVIREYFPAVEGDVVVFQRPTSKFQPQTIDRLQARGVAVVIDIDDDLGHVHPRNVAYWQMRPRVPVPDPRHPGYVLGDPVTGKVEYKRNVHSWHNAAEACRHAALVTVTTPALAQTYGAHGRVRVLPNMVRAEYLDMDHPDSADIGWAGVVSVHPNDLQVMGHAVARLVGEGHRFVTVGDQREVADVLGLDTPPDSTGPLPMDLYPLGVALFGIGVAPLADTRFNRAKSRLKALEYAALGVPWVGSPLPDYVALHRQGCGMLARRPRDWESKLRRLAGDPGLRRELSAAGRQVAARNTIEGHARDWLDTWLSARDRLPDAARPLPRPATRPEWSLPPSGT